MIEDGPPSDPRGGPAPAVPAPGGEPPARIVVVDDDAFSREFIVTLLREAGHDVRAFSMAEEALRAMTEAPPDVLVTDWFMPDMDGPSLIGRVREVASLVGTYCVLLTAFDAAGRKLEGLSGGADDYLPKEACRDELLIRIRVGTRVRRLERAASLVAMAATLGHEINNPLTGVLGYMELALHHLDRGDDAAVRTSLTKARDSAERIAGVVRRLMKLSDARLKTYRTGSLMLDLEEDAAGDLGDVDDGVEPDPPPDR